LRHFNLITINEFDDATYERIYGAISEWYVLILQSLPAAILASICLQTYDGSAAGGQGG
jgi:hypothetical protein